MRPMVLIVAAGLAWVTPVAARAQYYGWGYYRPYYPVPYGYYPAPYDAPPPMYEDAPRRIARRHSVQHRTVRPRQVTHRLLINPLLGPLPGAASSRRN